MEGLKLAHYRKVDVKLITPKISNHYITDLARSSYMRQLQEIGIEVILCDVIMLHAKAILFDHTAVMLGSVNIDNRSLFLNYEIVTFFYDYNTIKKVDKWISSFLSCKKYDLIKVTFLRKLAENMVKFIIPLL